MPDQPDEEELMARYLAEAGDPHVEPRPHHVARLRSLLLERLGSPPARPTRPWKARLLLGSGLVAAAVVLALLTFSRPVIAWAQLAQALQGRPWVHGKVSGPDGKLLFEQWLSSNRELSGTRAGPQVTFYNSRQKVLTKYVPAEGVIYRLPEPAAGEPNFLRQILDQLLDPAGPPRFPFPGTELIGQARREVEDGGKKWLEIELTLREAGGSRGPDRSMRIRVEPATKLPATLVFDAEDGKRYTAAIDYPDRGPADVYDLGAPRTAKVVDRIPPDAVGRVLAGLKAGRRQFDDYCAFVVEERIRRPDYLPRFAVHRVWHKGPKWRVEDLRPDRQDWAPPAGADTAWWKAHQGEFTFVPRALCDGKAYWDYYLADSWKPGMPVPKPGRPTASGQTVGPNQLLGPGADPVLPFWCQDLLPDQASHPTAGIGEPDRDREFLVDPKPTGGPAGTILLRGRDTNARAAGAPDHFRLWVDPEGNYLAMRMELRVGVAGDPAKVAYITTQVLEAVDTSPKGHRYPTRTRQSTSDGKHEVIRTFSVDFGAPVPDELFQPVK
jgi:hypothetical protein